MTKGRQHRLGSEQRLRGQRYALLANLFLQTTFFIVAGGMMMLFANDVLGFSPKRIAAIMAFSSLLAVFRIPLLPLIRSFGKVRTLLVTESLRFGVVLALFFIPASRLSFVLYLVLLLLYMGAAQLGMGVVWQPLLRDLTTHEDRGRFFARMRFAFTVAGLVLVGGVSGLIGSTVSERQYKILLGAAAFSILHRLFWTSKIPELRLAPLSPQSSSTGPRHYWMHVARTSPLLRRPLAIDALLVLTYLPVMVLYLRQMLNIPSNLISAYVFMITLGSAVSYLTWGRVADRIGFRPMMAGLLWLALATAPLVLLLSPLPDPLPAWSALPGRALLTVLILGVMGFLDGALRAGIGIASTSIQHYHVESEDSLEAMSLHSLAVVAMASAMAYLSGWFLEDVALPAGSFTLPGGLMELDGVKLYLAFIVPGLYLLILTQVKKLPQVGVYMGIAHFFSLILIQPVKGMLVFLTPGKGADD